MIGNTIVFYILCTDDKKKKEKILKIQPYTIQAGKKTSLSTAAKFNKVTKGSRATVYVLRTRETRQDNTVLAR